MSWSLSTTKILSHNPTARRKLLGGRALVGTNFWLQGCVGLRSRDGSQTTYAEIHGGPQPTVLLHMPNTVVRVYSWLLTRYALYRSPPALLNHVGSRMHEEGTANLKRQAYPGCGESGTHTCGLPGRTGINAQPYGVLSLVQAAHSVAVCTTEVLVVNYHRTHDCGEKHSQTETDWVCVTG